MLITGLTVVACVLAYWLGMQQGGRVVARQMVVSSQHALAALRLGMNRGELEASMQFRGFQSACGLIVNLAGKYL